MPIRPSLILLALAQWLALATLAAAQEHADTYPRPIPLGVSISTTPSSPFIFAGTGGMRVRSMVDPSKKFILSNNHVVGAVGPSLCPDTATPGVTQVIQPGTLDLGFDPGNNSEFFVGILANKVPIDFSAGANNLVDAGIVFTLPSLTSTEILGIGEPNLAVAFPFVGEPLIKSGRTSGVTTDSVQAVDTTILVNYGSGCGTARFVNQVTTGPNLGISGDSGSVVLDQTTLTPVGLFFAGSATQGVMNPIVFAYLALGVIVDSATAATPAFDASSGGPLTAEEVGLASDVRARHEAAVMNAPGVVGMGVGLDEAGGGPAIIVYVSAMTAAARRATPSQLEGIPVRMIESGEFVAF